MIPSLINEISVPYREKIARSEAQWETVDNEIGWLIAQSKAHEEFKDAAEICSLCSDELWLYFFECNEHPKRI